MAETYVQGTINLLIHLGVAIIAAIAAIGAYVLFFVLHAVFPIPIFAVGTFCLVMGAWAVVSIVTAVIIFFLLFINPKRACEFGFHAPIKKPAST